MKKYFYLIKTEWQRQLTYRTTILSFRAGNMIEVVVQLIIWTAIFKQADVVRGYSYDQMMTYVIVGWLILFITSNYGFERSVARDIHIGTLSNYLIKPVSYLKYIVVLAIGRSSLAMLSGVFIQGIIILFFHKRIILILDFIRLGVVLVMIILGYFIKLFLSIGVGLIAFWATEVGGLQYTSNILEKFLSGAYFPANLLPALFVNLSFLFPFIYTFFVPMQVYLGNIRIQDSIIVLLVEFVWLILLYMVLKVVWKIGLKRYEGFGI